MDVMPVLWGKSLSASTQCRQSITHIRLSEKDVLVIKLFLSEAQSRLLFAGLVNMLQSQRACSYRRDFCMLKDYGVEMKEVLCG